MNIEKALELLSNLPVNEAFGICSSMESLETWYLEQNKKNLPITMTFYDYWNMLFARTTFYPITTFYLGDLANLLNESTDFNPEKKDSIEVAKFAANQIFVNAQICDDMIQATFIYKEKPLLHSKLDFKKDKYFFKRL